MSPDCIYCMSHSPRQDCCVSQPRMVHSSRLPHSYNSAGKLHIRILQRLLETPPRIYDTFGHFRLMWFLPADMPHKHLYLPTMFHQWGNLQRTCGSLYVGLRRCMAHNSRRFSTGHIHHDIPLSPHIPQNGTIYIHLLSPNDPQDIGCTRFRPQENH